MHHHHTVALSLYAYLFRKLTHPFCKLVTASLYFFEDTSQWYFSFHSDEVSFRNGHFTAKKKEKKRFTFSQSVFTWVSLSCLHSISCSIHDSKSFAVALSSTIVIVGVLRVSKITSLFIFLRKSDRNMYKSTTASLLRLLPSQFNVRKTLWRSTNLDTDEAHA